jgi:aspartyl aminopeptidase
MNHFEKQIEGVVDLILEDYRHDREIDHMDIFRHPDRDVVVELIAKLRRIMDEDHIVWQTAEIGKVDEGGGGTISFILARMNMDVIDAGIAVLNMHSPSEISSKADLYEGYRAYIAFLAHMD